MVDLETINLRNTAFTEGIRAFKRGIVASLNPYTEANPIGHEMWLRGWDKAHEEFNKERGY